MLALLFSAYTKKSFSQVKSKTISIVNYYKGNWEDAFNKSLSDADCIVIPKGLTCDNFNFELNVPTEKKLIVNGKITGNGKGKIIINGENIITGKQGIINDVSIVITGGTPYISNLELTGYTQTARIVINGSKNKITNLIIDGLYIHNTNYGILRQGKTSTLIKARITNCNFNNLRGDAIEWNVAINDEQILIANHNIENINNISQKGFWGIGIGLSGTHYDNTYPTNKTVKNFIIENIAGKNLRQLIHVENGSDFIIRNISSENITDEFSKNSGLESATIAIYGSQNFKIEKIKILNSNGIIVGFGVNYGKYISAPQNFTISDVKSLNKKQMKNGIKMALGNRDSSVTISNIDIIGASLSILNKPESLTLENIKIKALDNNKSILIFDNKNDPRSSFSVRNPNKINILNVEGSSPDGLKEIISSLDFK
jgi:colanic acid biosynthesis protein WcaM